MQSQQVITRIAELEAELSKIKVMIQKKPVLRKGFVWGKINLLESQLEDAKGALFDFDIDKYVSEKDLALWK